LILPTQGVSAISSPGLVFHDPEADRALFNALRMSLRKDIPVVEVDTTINDPAFAEICAKTLLENIATRERTRGYPAATPKKA
jgi:uncharacterized protein (UPF0261 family)